MRVAESRRAVCVTHACHMHHGFAMQCSVACVAPAVRIPVRARGDAASRHHCLFRAVGQLSRHRRACGAGVGALMVVVGTTAGTPPRDKDWRSRVRGSAGTCRHRAAQRTRAGCAPRPGVTAAGLFEERPGDRGGPGAAAGRYLSRVYPDGLGGRGRQLPTVRVSALVLRISGFDRRPLRLQLPGAGRLHQRLSKPCRIGAPEGGVQAVSAKPTWVALSRMVLAAVCHAPLCYTTTASLWSTSSP